jgi:muramoyltetrapeptide carboxypeptidase
MDIPILHPRAVKPGDTIAVVAPAGTVEQRDTFQEGVAALARMGFRVSYSERIFESRRYLAGEDQARAEELMRAFEDPGIQAVIALRGGFGCARLIPLLDEHRLRQHCKLFMGFSDITTLHLYLRRRLGWVTVHGPMLTSAPLGKISAPQEEHLRSLWTIPDYRPQLSFHELQTWYPGVAEGRLTGGCLSLVVASLGTSYEIKTDGKILFLEDLGEEPYRLDRMLTQLKLAGKLEGLAGILLGSFQDCEPEGAAYTAAEVLREIMSPLEVPIVAGFPSGHGGENWALPLGLRVRLDADARTVEFLESTAI